jgi:N-sulfoglucosamine sulfohydrolase
MSDPGPNRREFLKRLSLTPLALSYWDTAMATEVAEQSRGQDRPNILVLMSDNHSWNHLGCYGDPVVRTPHIDALAEQGALFTHAYCAAPSCTPARAAMLAGQDIWRLEEGANLWGIFPDKFPLYTDLLETAGYHVGCQGKGWGQGNVRMSGREKNHAGTKYDSFAEFLQAGRDGRPWTFWISTPEPHRPHQVGAGIAAGLDPGRVRVPAYLPDHPTVRSDILDYLNDVETFDRKVGEVLEVLRRTGQEDNTLIVVTSDNGWQMPRGLANLYDFGVRIPFITVWPGRIRGGRVVDDFVNLNDVAPTFLELAGLPIPAAMTARSLTNVLFSEQSGRVDAQRDRVYTARERHAFCRQYGKAYPGRALRTHDYLYIRNYEPDRWPAGDPPLYGDVDAHMLHYPAPTKMYMLENRDDPRVAPLFELAFGKRPGEELFDLRRDPDQMNNVAGNPAYADVRRTMAAQLEEYLRATRDPRVVDDDIMWDTTMYYQPNDFRPRPSSDAIARLGLEEEYTYFPPPQW